MITNLLLGDFSGFTNKLSSQTKSRLTPTTDYAYGRGGRKKQWALRPLQEKPLELDITLRVEDQEGVPRGDRQKQGSRQGGGPSAPPQNLSENF
jgi:hypothetical protein